MDLSNMKLGKKDPRSYDYKRDALFANFVSPTQLPPPKIDLWWGARMTRAGISMSLNDSIGDCVVAMLKHMIDIWTSDIGEQDTISDGDVLKAYEEAGGYIPGNESTDNGLVIADFLDYMRITGIAGHKIDGNAIIENANISHICSAIDIFGCVACGVQLPITAQYQPNVWSVVPNSGFNGVPGSWGGHGIPLIGHHVINGSGYLLTISWGKLFWMTVDWFLKYVDEVRAVISKDWISAHGLAPSGFDYSGLLDAQSAL